MTYNYLDGLAMLGVGGAHPGGLSLTKNILSREKLDKTTSILDAGSGTGQTSAYIAEQFGCHVTALDSSEIMLDKAKQRFLSLNIPVVTKCGTTEMLPFDENSFDIVLSESVMTFTNVSLTIPEFKRVLKPNGVLLAIEMILEESLSEEEFQPVIDFYDIPRVYTESEWYDLFQYTGFQTIHVEKFTHLFDENDVENAPDFSLSENLNDIHFSILEEHEYLTNEYKNVLGYRIFRCSV